MYYTDLLINKISKKQKIKKISAYSFIGILLLFCLYSIVSNFLFLFVLKYNLKNFHYQNYNITYEDFKYNFKYDSLYSPSANVKNFIIKDKLNKTEINIQNIDFKISLISFSVFLKIKKENSSILYKNLLQLNILNPDINFVLSNGFHNTKMILDIKNTDINFKPNNKYDIIFKIPSLNININVDKSNKFATFNINTKDSYVKSSLALYGIDKLNIDSELSYYYSQKTYKLDINELFIKYPNHYMRLNGKINKIENNEFDLIFYTDNYKIILDNIFNHILKNKDILENIYLNYLYYELYNNIIPSIKSNESKIPDFINNKKSIIIKIDNKENPADLFFNNISLNNILLNFIKKYQK